MANSYLGALNTLIQNAGTGASVVKPVPLVPTDVPPVITMQQIDGFEVEAMEGLSGLTPTIMQINCWDKLYDNAFEMRRLIKESFKTVTGAVGSTGLKVDRITDFRYRELYDAQLEFHQLILRCQVWWTT